MLCGLGLQLYVKLNAKYGQNIQLRKNYQYLCRQMAQYSIHFIHFTGLEIAKDQYRE